MIYEGRGIFDDGNKLHYMEHLIGGLVVEIASWPSWAAWGSYDNWRRIINLTQRMMNKIKSTSSIPFSLSSQQVLSPL